MKKSARKPSTVRYAIVGLVHIAQSSGLPAFANARKNSQLAALISDDPKELRGLSRYHRAQHTPPGRPPRIHVKRSHS